MEIFKILFIVFLSVFALLFLFFSIKTKRFFQSLLINALAGLSVIIIINLTKRFTGIFIPINEYSVIISSAFGAPGVIALLLINIIFL